MPQETEMDPGEVELTSTELDRRVATITERMSSNLLLVIRDLSEAAYFLSRQAQVLAGVRIKHARMVLDKIASWEEEVGHE